MCRDLKVRSEAARKGRPGLHRHVLSGGVMHDLQERSCQESSCTDLVGTEPLVQAPRISARATRAPSHSVRSYSCTENSYIGRVLAAVKYHHTTAPSLPALAAAERIPSRPEQTFLTGPIKADLFPVHISDLDKNKTDYLKTIVSVRPEGSY